MNNLVSIVLPVYNSEKYLCECLDSIIAQSYEKFELIIIDDGSTDGSKSICDKYAGIHNRISVFHTENNGVSAARNLGIKKAKGEYLYFCDSDDVLSPEIIENLLNLILMNSSDMSVCSIKKFIDSYTDVDNKEEKILEYNSSEAVEVIMTEEKYSGYLVNKLFKLQLAKQISFSPDLKICEDEVFCLNYIRMIKKAVFTSKILYFYRQNMESASYQKFNTNKLSYILAKEQVLELLIRMNISAEIIKKEYFKLIYLYCSDYWKIKRLNNISDRKKWKRIIISGFKKRYKTYGMNPEWTIKHRLLYLYLIFICRFFHDK